MWQGIPFKRLSNEFLDSTNVVISKIPHIVVDTSPDWLGPVLSVLGAMFGGAIPAYVAIRAIRANKEQMLHQQMIINRQAFIDELRLRISTFLADAENMIVVINREITSTNKSFLLIPREQQEGLLALSHRLDISSNYIELMVGKNPRFKKIMEYINAIALGTAELLSQKILYKIDYHSSLLKQETVKCIEEEWQSVINTLN
ncbi:hypothetical protein ACPUEX_14820 [Enterobacter vonholyi]